MLILSPSSLVVLVLSPCHPPSLPGAADCIHVHWDHRFMGVGGDNTWEPDVVHPEFIVPASGVFDFELSLSPILPGQDPQALAASPFPA